MNIGLSSRILHHIASVSYTHLSKSKKLREFKLCNNHKVKMAANNGDNGGNEMEFEINNQVGVIGCLLYTSRCV